MTIRYLILLVVFCLAMVSGQWGRPPVMIQKTIIERPGFGRGPAWGRGPGWGGPGFGGGGGWGRGPTVIKETIIRPGK